MTPKEYDAWYDSPYGRWTGNAEFELLCSHLNTTPGTSLLDVGCGTGWFTRRLAAAGLEVTGLDVDAPMCSISPASTRITVSLVWKGMLAGCLSPIDSLIKSSR